jgi:hypothetical protein
MCFHLQGEVGFVSQRKIRTPMLSSIAAIPGVVAAALFHKQGDCIAEVLQPPYDSLLLAEAGRLAAGAQDCFAGIGVHPARITALSFEHGVVVVGQSTAFSAIVVASRDVNFTMLRVGLNVAVLKAQKSAEVAASGQMADPNASWRAGGESRSQGNMSQSEMGLSGSMGASRGFRPNESVGLRASVTTSVSGQIEGMSWGERSTRATGVVGMKVMHHLLAVYTRYVGNDARRLLERELLELRATPATLTVPQFADLIRRAGANIADPVDRRQFLQEALGDRSR